MIYDSIKKEISDLRNEIKKYDEMYFEGNESEISDYEYDMKLKRLEELETEYPELISEESPTQRVVSKGLFAGQLFTETVTVKPEKFSKVVHSQPMRSLSKAFTIGEVSDFHNRVVKALENEKITYVSELKLDGLSISVTYKNGGLIRGVTRGDGTAGEDVTENIIAIKAIPKKLNKSIDIEVRGEILLPIVEFEKINAERLEKSEEIFANPRNAASGTLRQLDSKIVAERNLDCFFYQIVNPENYGLTKHSESFNFIKEIGLKTNENYTLCAGVSEIEADIKKWESAREKLPYETDGIVIKVDEYKYYDILGNTTKSPRWALAFKYPAKQMTTKLLGVTFQVGRTGTITPVAELKPVELSGSVVRRATLHNFDEIKRKGIMINDTVFIEKSGEIIPQVVKPVVEKRDGNEIEITEPINCPVCGTELARDEGGIFIKCPNEECPDRIKRKLEYFVSRDAMNIEGMGTKLVERFVDEGFIREITDIYKLTPEKLTVLDRLGEKSVSNLMSSIELSKERGYSKVLYSLGITGVGRYLADVLAKKSGSIDKLMEMTIEELLEIEDVGDKVAAAVFDYFKSEKNITVINELKQMNVIMKETGERFESDKFAGRTFLITGTLSKYKRDEMREIIEKNGGKYLSSVSKNLNYLVAGDDPGSKLEKANKLGINVISEDDVLEMLK